MAYHPLAKLTDKKALQVWTLYWEKGWTQTALAKKFNVTQPTISNVVHKQFYRDVTKPCKIPKNWKGRTCSTMPPMPAMRKEAA